MSHERMVMILMAEDDPDDRLLIEEALSLEGTPNDVRCVDDGVELLEYLEHRGSYADLNTSPAPDLVLLDLNMPRMDGREALSRIKGDPKLRHIPVVVLTTSSSQEDVEKTYRLGGNSFISKPTTFDGLTRAIGTLKKYWFRTARLPST